MLSTDSIKVFYFDFFPFFIFIHLFCYLDLVRLFSFCRSSLICCYLSYLSFGHVVRISLIVCFLIQLISNDLNIKVRFNC